ncbi:MAG: YidC/Oxa1 family membrane protein insertase, partial [Patescibacteria group bacterium]
MGPITFIYNEFIYRPLLNGLIFLYATLPYRDLGLAIIILTAIVRILLHPTLVQTIRSQQAMARIGPKLREIQERFRDNKEEQAKKTMALYREEGIHPLSGCVPILIQLPILIGLYQVFWKGIAAFDPTLIYSFLPSVQTLDP